MGVFDEVADRTPEILSTPPNAGSTRAYRRHVDAPSDYPGQGDAREALTSLHPLSPRSRRRARDVLSSARLTFDAAKAQVLVFMAGDRTQVPDRTHGPAQSGNDDMQAGTSCGPLVTAGATCCFRTSTRRLERSAAGLLPRPCRSGKLTIGSAPIIFT
jgi:hypothetical protein